MSVLAVDERSAGFTLMELLMVMGVLSVLMGLGIGFLQRGDNSTEQFLAVLRSELRGAALTARAHGVPTEVIATPGVDGLPGQLRSSTLVPLASWHLEPDELFVDASTRPQLAGVDEPRGRFGHAMGPDPKTGASLFTLPLGPGRFPLEQGFVLRLDLKLEASEPMVLVRLGEGLNLELTADLIPHLRMVQSAGARRGVSVEIKGAGPVPLYRWFTLEILHDGRELVLGVDGVEVRGSAAQPMRQLASDVLEISPGDGPIFGLVDEISLFAYESGDAQMIPVDLELLGLQGPLRFGRDGQLKEPVTFQLRSGDQITGYSIDLGGVVR